MIRRIEGSLVHLDLIPGTAEQRRAAARAEVAAGIFARLTIDRHGILRKDRGSVKQRTMMLAAIEAVTDAHAIRAACGDDPDRTAQARTRMGFGVAHDSAVLLRSRQ